MHSSSNIEQIGELGSRWVENRVELVKLRFKAGNIKLFTTFMKVFLPALCLFLTFFFSSLGVVWLINQSIDSRFIGYFIMGGFYLLLAVILYLFREPWIVRPMGNLLIKVFEDEED